MKINYTKVEDALPETRKPVLAVVGKIIIKAIYVPQYTICDEDEGFEGDCDYHEEKDRYYWPEGWYEWNLSEDTHWNVSGKVTHWSPLPDLPEEINL